MSPEAYALAEHRLRLDAKDAARVFNHDIAQKNAELSFSIGVSSSSGMGLAATNMTRDEFAQRAMNAWTICHVIIEADDSVPGEETRQQILDLLTLVVRTLSTDVDELYAEHLKRAKLAGPPVDSLKERAIDLTMSEVDIALLRRRKKRLPLGDALRAPRYAATLTHWNNARTFGEQSRPDSIAAFREAVNALEALAKTVAPGGGATLGECIRHFRSRQLIDLGADKLLEGLWVRSNAAQGVRHGGPSTVALSDQEWSILRPMFEAALTIVLKIDATIP